MAITPSDYARKCDVTIAHTFGSAQTGFVAVLTENSLPAEIFTTALNGGGDIVVCADENGTTRLPIEVVKFDTVASEAVIWVRMPTANTSSVLWVFYGKAGESQPAVDALYGRNQVYTGRIQQLHFSGNTDSTGNTSDFIYNGTASESTSGIIGNCADFTPTSSAQTLAASGASMSSSTSTKVSCWIYRRTNRSNDNFSENYFGLYTAGGTTDGLICGIQANRLVIYSVGGNTTSRTSAQSIALNTWYKLDVVYDQVNNTVAHYVNGALDGNVVTSYTDDSTVTNGHISWGDTTNIVDYGLDGLIDEAYLTNDTTTQSSDYISAEYANQSNDATFWTVGTPSDTVGSTGVTSTATFSVTQPVFTSSASATVPAPIANGNFTLVKPTFTATTTVTLPQPISTASFTIDKPSVTASATATLPSFNASASFTVGKPSIESSATVTLPNPTTSGGFTVPGATFSVSALATLPQPESSISFTLNAPTFSATGEATQGQAQAEFSVTKPSFNASANVTLPQPVSAIDYAVEQPTFTVSATVSGLTITAASDARITLGAASNRLTLQAATNRITIN